MKIFYIYTALTTKGGADRVITDKANWLSEHGFDVTIVTDTQMDRPPIYPLAPQVRLHDFAIDFDQEYGHSLPLRAWWYFKLMKKYKKTLSEYLAREKPDIVISTLGRDLDFLTELSDGSIKIAESHIARKFSRNFHLMEQKGGLHKWLARYWRRKQEKCVKKLSGLVLLTNQDAKSWEGITQTYVIPNSLTFYPSNSSTCLNKQAIVVGRFNEQKGYDYLIEVWSLVNKRHPDWKLNVYGAGELRSEIEAKIRRAGLVSNMILNEPTSDIKSKYLDSSIYIMSSRFEGFPMALLEAMACGVPCVSFDCPCGPSDIIKNGIDGIVVDYLNIVQLADQICYLIENDTCRVKMGKLAKQNIARYSRENVMRLWVDLFYNLTNKK